MRRLAPLLLALWLAWPLDGAAQSIALIVPPAGAARDAWQALEDGRYPEAEKAFALALQSRPDDAASLVGHGIALQRLGRLSGARDAFAAALRIDPAMTPASLLLGLLLHELGDVPGAIRVYEAALVRAPGHRQLEARLARWQKEAALESTFQQAYGSHFVVLFEGPADEALAQRAVAVLDAAYQRIGAALLTFPPDPITVVVYTQEQFSDITRSPAWSGGLFDGRIRVPMRGALDDPGELDRVLTHEYVHALVYSIAPRGVPAWLNEGLAGVFERGGVERARLEATPAGRPPLPSLASLSSGFSRLPPAEVRRAYAASTLAVKALLDRVGPLGVASLIADLGAGTPVAEAFLARTQMTIEEFDAEWRGAPGREAGSYRPGGGTPGGRMPTTSGRSGGGAGGPELITIQAIRLPRRIPIPMTSSARAMGAL